MSITTCALKTGLRYFEKPGCDCLITHDEIPTMTGLFRAAISEHTGTVATTQDLEDAADTLLQSERGQQAMRDLLRLLESGATGLDAEGKRSVRTLLDGAFGAFAGSAVAIMYGRRDPR